MKLPRQVEPIMINDGKAVTTSNPSAAGRVKSPQVRPQSNGEVSCICIAGQLWCLHGKNWIPTGRPC